MSQFDKRGLINISHSLTDEYQELTPQEEADLENLLSRENAIQDAAALMENLSEELSQLDQGNIHQLMGSEAQIQELMEHLDQTVGEIEKMEMRMNVYDELLTGVRDTMHKLGAQYTEILLQNTNLQALSTEVNKLVVSKQNWLKAKALHLTQLCVFVCVHCYVM